MPEKTRSLCLSSNKKLSEFNSDSDTGKRNCHIEFCVDLIIYNFKDRHLETYSEIDIHTACEIDEKITHRINSHCEVAAEVESRSGTQKNVKI